MKENIIPIPSGYHSLNIYIPVVNAIKAMQFYKKAFGAIEKSRYSLPDNRILFAEIQIGDSTLQLSEEFLEHAFKVASPLTLKGKSCIIHLYVKDVDAIFESAINAGARIQTPIINMFYGDRYGQLEDPFGHLWSISTRVKNVTPLEVQEGFSQLTKNIVQSQTCHESRSL